jgi:hypothetical protein
MIAMETIIGDFYVLISNGGVIMDSENNEQQCRIISMKSQEYKDRYISVKPSRVIRVGNREFHLFKYYDESIGQEVLDLPRFVEDPHFTDEGRPFASIGQEPCPHGKSGDPDAPELDECCDCILFCSEKPADYIGICMCEERKQKSKEENTK